MSQPKNIKLYLVLLVILGQLFYQCTNSSSSEQDQENNELSSNDPNQEEWLAIFDGQNFEDWTPKFSDLESGVNYKNTFLVKDNLLQVRYEGYPDFEEGFKFGHLFYKDKFSYYRLRAKYRFVGEQVEGGPAWAFRNNGLMLHCQAPETMALDQDFPNSLELQLLGGENERSTGNLCTPGTHVYLADTLCTEHCINSNSQPYPGDQWIEVEAIVLGDSVVQHLIEGEVVFTFTQPTLDDEEDPSKPGKALEEGYISIQSETHPIDFEKIEVLNLCGCMDEKAKNFKNYYIKADNSTCIY